MSNFFAKIIVNTFSVVAKSFLQAYQQVISNGKGAPASQNLAKASRRGMKPSEALMVLNIESTALNRQNLDQQYEKYFANNDPKKGGSFYLQSKIFRAKEALERELISQKSGAGEINNTNSNSNNSS